MLLLRIPAVAGSKKGQQFGLLATRVWRVKGDRVMEQGLSETLWCGGEDHEEILQWKGRWQLLSREGFKLAAAQGKMALWQFTPCEGVLPGI